MILDGKKLADKLKKELIIRLENLKNKGIIPKLVIYWVGDNPSSAVYIRQKQQLAKEIGAICEVRKFSDESEEEDIIGQIKNDNSDQNCHGIIVQLPLPGKFNKISLIETIDPRKDVDGLHSFNQWRLMTGAPGLIPATAKGIFKILDANQITVNNRKVVVVGRSSLVGLPSALLALQKNATVTICHSHTQDLAFETKQADILIVAAGSPHLIGSAEVKQGAVVIDVGITRRDKKLAGDVDREAVGDKISAITPVPGGVGPMTVICLWENLLEVAENMINEK